MNKRNDMTLSECLALNDPNINHVFVALVPYRALGKRAERSPLEQLSDSGYISADDTSISNGQTSYKFNYGRGMSTLWVRPYIFQLWDRYQQEQKKQNRKPKFSGLLSRIKEKYRSIPTETPLISDWQQYTQVPLAPPKVYQSEAVDYLLFLIDDPRCEYITEYYACLGPLTYMFSEFFKIRPYTTLVKSALEQLGYANITKAPDFGQQKLKSQSVHIPFEYHTQSQVWIRPSVIPIWKQELKNYGPTLSISKLLVYLYRLSTHSQQRKIA
jgi:hypothetical protein